MRVRDTLRWMGALSVFGLAACGPGHPPPRGEMFGGLPISGSLALAHRTGFTDCFEDTGDMRCRRTGVMFDGQGPYNAAVDLDGSDGSGGFDQVTLWHDRDQYALYAIADTLKRQGWLECYTAVDDRGDQVMYSRKDVPVIVSMDLSYWGKRRLRIIPAWNHRERRC